jgi:CubicO group peptidase (beta-lactamase class C family)
VLKAIVGEWDLIKPQLGNRGATCASMTSFGHTGFTGTMAWADPETEIVFIFYLIELIRVTL